MKLWRVRQLWRLLPLVRFSLCFDRRRCHFVAGRLGTVRLMTLVLLGLSLAGAAGCVHAPPPIQPWQREYLSKRAMRFDVDPLEMRFRQHMWGSREGSDLGFGQPGGGCGCN